MLLVQGIGDQVSAGSNVQNAIVRLTQYRANTVRDTTGLCECSGGNGHCSGCDALPVFQTRTRVNGVDGNDGLRGETPVDTLFPGRNGRPGEAVIFVKLKSAGAEAKQYRSCFQLELVDFDLEDENEDGIFEPGEHLFIRRIRIKNTGGMPSPTRETRLELDASEHFQPLSGKEGVATVPSIPSGHTITLPNSIKVLIREPSMPMPGGQAYLISTNISLKATMPGLNRRLNHFEYQKSLEIRYPLELQSIDYLHSVAQGSEHHLAMQIFNRSNKVFGANQNTPRRAEVKTSMPSEAGSLRTDSGTWNSEVFKETGTIGALSNAAVSQTSKISHKAKDHAYTTIHAELLISSPGPPPAAGKSLGDVAIPFHVTQSFDLKIQISAAHVYDEEAGILVVTNVKTPPERFEAIGDFIHRDLHLKMGVWNVSQYGGLISQDRNEVDDDSYRNILEEYRGRTIIFLGNKFEHFGVQEQTMINLCESRLVGNECFAGSSCLLLGAAASKDKRDVWLRNSVFPVTHKISDMSNKVTESATFEATADLTRSISEQRTAGTAISQAYQLASEPKRYCGGPKRTVKHHARQAQNYLKSRLPHERLWVCPVYPRIDGGNIKSGYVAVWHGLPSNRSIFATESKNLIEGRGKRTKLHPFDEFNIISSLSYSLRVHLLQSSNKDSSIDMGEKDDGHESVTSQESRNHPTQMMDAVQFSIEEDIAHEIRNYLNPSSIFNSILLGGSRDPAHQFSVHFPCIDTVLQHFDESDGFPPRILEVLQVAIAATYPQTKRQVARKFVLPIGQRRAQLNSYITRRIVGILTNKGYGPDSLKEFRVVTQAKHSSFSGTKRDTVKLIEERNRKFVKVPMNEYRKGRQSTKDVVEGTVLCTEAEWDARFSELEKTRVGLKRSVTKAMQKRGQMSTLMIPDRTEPVVSQEEKIEG